MHRRAKSSRNSWEQGWAFCRLVEGAVLSPKCTSQAQGGSGETGQTIHPEWSTCLVQVCLQTARQPMSAPSPRPREIENPRRICWFCRNCTVSATTSTTRHALHRSPKKSLPSAFSNLAYFEFSPWVLRPTPSKKRMAAKRSF